MIARKSPFYFNWLYALFITVLLYFVVKILSIVSINFFIATLLNFIFLNILFIYDYFSAPLHIFIINAPKGGFP